MSTEVVQKQETEKHIFGATTILFWIIGFGFLSAGFINVFSVAELVGGDAYNYIIAASRGIALICISIFFLVFGGVFAVINVIRNSSPQELSQHPKVNEIRSQE